MFVSKLGIELSPELIEMSKRDDDFGVLAKSLLSFDKVVKNLHLRSCPFCGGEARLTSVSETDGTWVVMCDICEAYGPSPEGAHAISEDGAIDDWNRRPSCEKPLRP